MSRFCVFCGANPKVNNDSFIKQAEKLGELIAKNKHELIYGGSAAGLMGTLANSCLSSGGKVIGVMPHFLKELEILHPGLSEVNIVNDLMERKKYMMSLADAFIILPGGVGTMDELLEVLSTFQLRLHSKSIYILNVDGYYDHFLNFLNHTRSIGFLPNHTFAALKVHRNVERLFESLE